MESHWKFAFATAAGAVLVACNLFGNSSPTPPGEPNSPQDDDDRRVHIEWEAPVKVVSGAAYRGPWRMNESDFHYVDDPDVAVDDRGQLAIVWVDNEAQDVFFQAFDDDGESAAGEATNVSSSPDIFSWLPRVEFGEEPDTVHVLWQEIAFTGGSHGGEIYFARSTDGGESFDAPLNLSDSPAGAGKGRTSPERWHNGSLDMATGPDGHIYASWTDYEGPLWVSRSTDGGQSFDEPVQVAGDDDDPTRSPSLATGGNGDVYVAWTYGERSDADIYVSRSTDRAASFDEPLRAIDTEGHSDSPSLAIDDDTLHLTMADSPDGRFGRYAVHYARSEDGGRTFEDSRELSAPATDSREGAAFPSLELDTRGNPHVLWEHFPDYEQRPLGLMLASAGDAGEDFKDPVTIENSDAPSLGINGGLQGLLMDKIAIGDDGTIAIVHSRYQDGVASHIQLFRGQID